MPPKLSTTSYAVLGLLTFGEMSGYDVLKMSERSVGHFWSPAKSHVYTELRRLAGLGLASEKDVRQEQRPDKRLYAITAAGQSALESWLAGAAVEPDQVRSPFTLRVFFGHLVPSALLVAQVAEVRRTAELKLAELRTTEAEIKDKPELFYPYLTLKAGLVHTEATILWADEVLDALKEKENV